MPSLTRLICLAYAHRRDGRFVAGIDPSTGRWIRAVSDAEHGQLPAESCRIGDQEPKLLEIIDLPLADSGPDFGSESENRLLLPGAWEPAGQVKLPDLASYIDRAPLIFDSADPQCPPTSERRSLQLVEARDFSARRIGDGNWHGSFTTAGGHALSTRIIDPAFIARLEDGHQASVSCLLTICLSPLGDQPRVWKLIAAVIDPALFGGEDELHQALEQLFGYTQFRPFQQGIIEAAMAGRDVFAVLPTGGGKSMCYQLPAHLLPAAVVVVSPLIALMKDQVDSACAAGLRAACFNSTIPSSDRVHTMRLLMEGQIDLLYIAPERLTMDAFLQELKRAPIAMFAIDEAHCVSEWGHDFRPDYLFLGQLSDHFPKVPIAAFTATATLRVQADIVSRLKLRTPHMVRASFNRPNLYYEAKPRGNEVTQLCEFVAARPRQAGIVYCGTRKRTETIANVLRGQGVVASAYHAGLSPLERDEAQVAFTNDRIQVVVATVAFGMGIDKPNVRFVVHADMPKNLESYSQETGRAGRDGDPAHCLMIWGKREYGAAWHHIKQIADSAHRDAAVQRLQQMMQFASSSACRRRQVLAYFDEEMAEANCGNCDVCTGAITRIDATLDAQKALSAIHRSGGRFGSGYIIDIVRGANTAKIRQFRHEELKTWGCGKDKPKDYWQHVLRDLLAQEHLEEGEFHVLQIGETGNAILRGQANFQMVEHVASGGSRKRAEQPEIPYNEALFKELREIRRETAEAQGVAAFVVFADRTLADMCRYFPTTPEAMLAISGVGETRLARYGQRFMAGIHSFLEREPELAQQPRAAPPRLEVRGISATIEHTYALLKEGLDYRAIAEKRSVTVSTIATHIERLIGDGREIDIAVHVPDALRDTIVTHFKALGSAALGPIIEAGGGDFDYADARIVRAWMTK
ncbi:MAG: ATP-dependent DNA helicase RecQ [Rhodothermales bacterium]|jgi:ATP-dependent DNA helicase RecQ